MTTVKHGLSIAHYLTLLAFLVVIALFYFTIEQPLLVNRSGGSQAVYDANGKLLRLSLSSDEKYRLWTPLREISPALIEATLLYEDRRFFSHPGVDLQSLIRAFATTYLYGTARTGGSTITMQLARMRFVIDSRTVLGKLEQMIRAIQLEAVYSKEEILEAYLNLAPYGENIEGVGAASRIYFGRASAELSLPEALTLAVIPQNPTKRRPTASRTEPLQQARARLFANWLGYHPDDAQFETDLQLPLRVATRSELPDSAPHFVQGVLRMNPDSSEIKTTLDPELQEIVERKVSSFIEANSSSGISNSSVLLASCKGSAKRCSVNALVGSADFSNIAIAGQVDGTRAKRSPGSALKPFIYGLALDEGLIHPRTVLKDTPASFASYDPENFDHEFVGPIAANYALIRSRNLPAVELTNKLEGEGFYGFLRRARVSNMRERDFYGLSLALGGVEVSLNELVAMYASLLTDGSWIPLAYTSADRQTPVQPVRLLSPEASFLVRDMLTKNPRPGMASIEEDPSPLQVAWKTGTSFGFRDAWSVGVFGDFVLGVWVGNFDGKGNPAFVGRESAGRLFFEIVDAIYAQRGLKSFYNPASSLHLKKVDVCSVSGQLPGAHCKHLVSTWFIPGVSPISPCSVHREVAVEQGSGLRACDEDGPNIVKAVYEFWPTDLLELFTRAGVPRKVPPSFAPHCPERESFGIKPEIKSPERGLIYQMRLAHLREGSLAADEPIPFKAVADADTKLIHWFVDAKFVGNTVPTETLFWNPSPGRFVVRAVDDSGRADSRELLVETVQ